jgi:hypothetical protein
VEDGDYTSLFRDVNESKPLIPGRPPPARKGLKLPFNPFGHRFHAIGSFEAPDFLIQHRPD